MHERVCRCAAMKRCATRREFQRRTDDGGRQRQKQQHTCEVGHRCCQVTRGPSARRVGDARADRVRRRRCGDAVNTTGERQIVSCVSPRSHVPRLGFPRAHSVVRHPPRRSHTGVCAAVSATCTACDTSAHLERRKVGDDGPLARPSSDPNYGGGVGHGVAIVIVCSLSILQCDHRIA